MKRYALGLVWALSLWVSGCVKSEDAPKVPAMEPISGLTSVAVERREGERLQPLPGTVQPIERAMIASKILATVSREEVTIGKEVKGGDLLVQLDADEILAREEQAQANLSQVERRYEREQVLLAQGATTAESVRTLEEQLRMAKATLSEASTMVSYTRIEAPFSGTITSDNVQRGDLATPGKELLTLENLNKLEIRVQVPDSLGLLPYGTPIQIEGNQENFSARIYEWSPSADIKSRTRLMRLIVPEGSDLRSGQYVKVLWPAEKTTSYWIPETAILRFGQIEGVFALENKKARLQIIQTAKEADGWRQVTSGLKGNESVITNPPANLLDGQPLSKLNAVQ